MAFANYVDNNQIKLSHCEFIPTPNSSEQSTVLYKLVAEYGLDEFACHLVLTTYNYRRVNIDASVVDENEMNKAIRWKLIDFVYFSIEKAVFDYYSAPVSMCATSSNMLEVVVCSNVLIKELADKSTQSELQLKVIDIQETVLRNLAAFLPENKRGVAVLYLQESSGNILVQKEGIIYLSRNFDIGYQDLGLASQNSSDDGRSGIVQNNLALEIQRSLDYVESYYSIPAISGLVVIPLAENTHELVKVGSRLGPPRMIPTPIVAESHFSFGYVCGKSPLVFKLSRMHAPVGVHHARHHTIGGANRPPPFS